MYKRLNKLVNEINYKEISIPINKIKNLENNFIEIDDIFIGVKANSFIAYDRVCNHNGGQLNLDSNRLTATCPLHKWKLNLSQGIYENGCNKTPLETRIESNEIKILKKYERFQDIFTSGLTESEINFNFNAHASVSIAIDEINIISDPWLIGSCFANGWWHAFPPSEEAIERLKNSDLIFISHNHSDHLHIPTLIKFVDKNKSILVPNFQSKSVENLLLKLGYNNLILCDFMEQIYIETKKGGLKLVVVKSGDQRDDSSLLICTGNKKVFLGVDTNSPNQWILPKVDLLFTLFAGGASGFPVRVENFQLEQKTEIVKMKRFNVLNNHVANLINATKPDYVIPYAGYFTEIARDNDVKIINVKNSPKDLMLFMEEKFPNIKMINPIETPHFSLIKGGLKFEEKLECPAYFVDEDYIESIINETLNDIKELSTEELVLVGNKFLSSAFQDNLTVVFIPTDDLLNQDTGVALIIDFSNLNRSAKIIILNGETDIELTSIIKVNINNLELLRVRAESLAMVIRNGLPLEDLSIGFQIKMYRQPNIYNFKFWNYFTNKELISI